MVQKEKGRHLEDDGLSIEESIGLKMLKKDLIAFLSFAQDCLAFMSFISYDGSVQCSLHFFLGFFKTDDEWGDLLSGGLAISTFQVEISEWSKRR